MPQCGEDQFRMMNGTGKVSIIVFVPTGRNSIVQGAALIITHIFYRERLFPLEMNLVPLDPGRRGKIYDV